MKLFLIRHAEAIEFETETVRTDELRYITSLGRMVTKETADNLRDECKDLDRIFTSPLIRAVQTAETIATQINFTNDVELINEMRNESSIASLQQFIRRNSGLEAIALVGHEPKISLLVRVFSDRRQFQDFGKSSVCLIEYDVKSEEGKFLWYFNSKDMGFEK